MQFLEPERFVIRFAAVDLAVEIAFVKHLGRFGSTPAGPDNVRWERGERVGARHCATDSDRGGAGLDPGFDRAVINRDRASLVGQQMVRHLEQQQIFRMGPAPEHPGQGGGEDQQYHQAELELDQEIKRPQRLAAKRIEDRLIGRRWDNLWFGW